MSSGGGQQTTTTQTNPSPYLTPSIANATQGAQNQFLGNNALTNMGTTALANRGLQGSPVTGAAQNLATNTMNGDFLSPDSNPYLQQTFNRAADLTRTRLDSEFAGAGRNLGAAMPARSEELQTLASNIYGQNYARERGIQANTVGQANALANQDYTDINALLDAGNMPVDTLINRIGALAPAAGGTAMSSQPINRNPVGSAIGGAAVGGTFGIPGALIGGGLGGLAGLLG